MSFLRLRQLLFPLFVPGWLSVSYWFSFGTSYQFSDRLGFDFGYTFITNLGDAEIDKTATGEDTFRGALKGEYDGHSHIAAIQLA